MSDAPKKRPWLQFSLGTLVCLVLTFGVCLGIELRDNSWLRHRAQVAIRPSPSTESQAVNGLRISLTADKRILTPKEQVTFTMKIQNNTTNAIQIYAGHGPFHVFESGQCFRRLRPGANGVKETAPRWMATCVVPRMPDKLRTVPANDTLELRCGAVFHTDIPGQELGSRVRLVPGLVFYHQYQFALGTSSAGPERFLVRYGSVCKDGVAQFRMPTGDRPAPEGVWTGEVCSNQIELEMMDDLTGFSWLRAAAYLSTLTAFVLLNEWRIRRRERRP